MYTRWKNAPHWLRKRNKKRSCGVATRQLSQLVCRLRKWLYAWFVRATYVGDSKDWSVTAATDGVIARVRPVRKTVFTCCSKSV